MNQASVVLDHRCCRWARRRWAVLSYPTRGPSDELARHKAALDSTGAGDLLRLLLGGGASACSGHPRHWVPLYQGQVPTPNQHQKTTNPGFLARALTSPCGNLISSARTKEGELLQGFFIV